MTSQIEMWGRAEGIHGRILGEASECNHKKGTHGTMSKTGLKSLHSL